MAFDPDAYLAKKEKSSSVAFDPDAYLAKKESADPFRGSGFLGRIKKIVTGDPVVAAEVQKSIDARNEAIAKEGLYNEGAAKIMGVGQGALLGYLPQAQAITRPPLKAIYEGVTGETVPDKSYVEARDANIARLEEMKRRQPLAFAGGELAGTVGTGILTAPISPALRIGKAVPYLSKSGILPTAAKGALQGLEYGLIANPGDVKGEVSPLQLGERIDKGLEGARSGALTGGGLALAGKAAKAVPSFGKKLMTVFLGPNKSEIDYYLKNYDGVNNAKDLPALKAKIDAITSKLADDVEQGKISVQNAKDLVKDVQNNINRLNDRSQLNFQIKKNELSYKFKDATKALDSAYKESVQKLKDVKAPVELADDVTTATRELKGKITEGSKAAREKLAGPGQIDISKAFSAIDEAKQGLSIAGKGAVTPQAQAAVKELENLEKTFGVLPAQISMDEAKNLIQQIDRSERAVYNSPDFTDDVAKAYQKIRRNVDELLKKSSPEYAEAMKPVAAMTGLHADVAPKFGERESAISTLSRIGSPTSQVQRENLIKLGEMTGRDYKTPIKKYMQAQGLLDDPRALAVLKSNLPENKKFQKLEKIVRGYADPRAKEKFMSRQLEKSGLIGEKQAAEGILRESEEALAGARARMEPLRGVTEGTSESKIRTLMTAKPDRAIEVRKQMQELTKLSDTDFEKAINDLRVKEALEGGRPHGSRSVNLFATIGAAIGSVAGPGGAAAGASAGSSMGAAVDKFGGQMAKKILDGVIKMGNTPTMQKIKSLDISPEAKDFLMQQLIRYKAAQSK